MGGHGHVGKCLEWRQESERRLPKQVAFEGERVFEAIPSGVMAADGVASGVSSEGLG